MKRVRQGRNYQLPDFPVLLISFVALYTVFFSSRCTLTLT